MAIFKSIIPPELAASTHSWDKPNCCISGPNCPDCRAALNVLNACWNWGDCTVDVNWSEILDVLSGEFGGSESRTFDINSSFDNNGWSVSSVKEDDKSTVKKKLI